LSMVGARS